MTRFTSANTTCDAVLFGSHDGCVHCVGAASGSVLWRFSASEENSPVYATPFPVQFNVHKNKVNVVREALVVYEGELTLYLRKSVPFFSPQKYFLLDVLAEVLVEFWWIFLGGKFFLQNFFQNFSPLGMIFCNNLNFEYDIL